MSVIKPRTVVKIQESMPALAGLGAEFLIIVDKKLQNRVFLKKWMRDQGRAVKLAIYWVPAGESLKDLKNFSWHLANIQKLLGAEFERNLKFIGIGGGSVGDFAGFVASIFKRGCDLIQIPTTLLAAIDSAHGGKNGLNVSGIKNQIGTFHFPSQVFIVKVLFHGLELEHWIEAYGELYKMGWLEGGVLWQKINKMKRLDFASIWPLLGLAIAGKNKIVKKDPFETRGLRHLLNLGHTMGHVFEVQFKIPHGLAVLLGIDFALGYSAQLGLLKTQREEIYSLPSSQLLSDSLAKSDFKRINYPSLLKIPKKDLLRLLSQDKKRTAGHNIKFIFPVRPGFCTVRNVSIEQLIAEFERQRIFFQNI